jgi:hypothetical protein
MKTLMTCICTTALVCAGTFAAPQDKSTASKQSKEVQQETKTSTTKRTTKVKTDTVNGKVESFEAGKSIKVTVPGKIVSTKSWSLDDKDWTYQLPGDVKPGDWVTVSEKTDSNGHKSLAVKHSSKQGTASRSKSAPYR